MPTRWHAIPLQQRQRLTCTLGVAALVLYPVVDGLFHLHLLNAVTDAAVLVILALGLNIVVGFAGLLDLGYAAFFAIGAYTTGILTWPPHGLELNFWWAMWLSVPVAALFGILIGAPTLRVRGDYLAIITLAFGEIVPIAFRNMWQINLRIGDWTLVHNFNLTNGPQGLNPVGRPHILGYEFGFDPLPWYFLVLAVGALVIFAASRLEKSRLGRAWMAGPSRGGICRQVAGHLSGAVSLSSLDYAALYCHSGRYGQPQRRHSGWHVSPLLRPGRAGTIHATGAELRPAARQPDADACRSVAVALVFLWSHPDCGHHPPPRRAVAKRPARCRVARG
jgi:hypothetical protein